MLWPDVLGDIKDKINSTLLSAGYEDVPVYLGASAAVPNDDGVYVIRGETLPADNMCDVETTTVYVEVWAKADSSEAGTDDVSTENNHVLASWSRLADMTYRIQRIDFSADQPGYSIDHDRTDGDGGAFHPVAAERITFRTRYGVSNG